MKYTIKIKDGCFDFEGIGKLPMSEVILFVDDYATVRADFLIANYLNSQVGIPINEAEKIVSIK